MPDDNGKITEEEWLEGNYPGAEEDREADRKAREAHDKAVAALEEEKKRIEAGD